MTPSQQAKAAGLKSLQQVVAFHGLKDNGEPMLNIKTLRNWHEHKPSIFKTMLIGTAIQIEGYTNIKNLDAYIKSIEAENKELNEACNSVEW